MPLTLQGHGSAITRAAGRPKKLDLGQHQETDDIGCYCEHISKVKQELGPTLQLDDDVATKVKSMHLELNPPYSMKCHFLLPFVKTCRKMNSRGANLIQRVSEESFLVRDPELTQAHP